MLEIRGGCLLVPVSIVAQIISRSGLASAQSKLHCARHTLNWREYQIPLVYSSELCGGAPGADDAFERAAVLWPMQGAGATDMIALSSQSAPRVVSMPPDSRLLEWPVSSDYVLGAVSMEGGLGIIPDLQKLSHILYGGAPDA